MRQAAYSPWVVRWQSDVLPPWVRLSRAVLLCAVGAVLMQSALNVVWDFPAWILHLLFFCGFFGLWSVGLLSLKQLRTDNRRGAWPHALVLSPESVYAEGEDANVKIKVRIRQVARFWGALAVEIEPISGQMGQSASRQLARIVIWRSSLNPVLYRKMSVLLHWHWRGAA